MVEKALHFLVVGRWAARHVLGDVRKSRRGGIEDGTDDVGRYLGMFITFTERSHEFESVNTLGPDGLLHVCLVKLTNTRVALFVPVFSIPRCPDSCPNIGLGAPILEKAGPIVPIEGRRLAASGRDGGALGRLCVGDQPFVALNSQM